MTSFQLVLSVNSVLKAHKNVATIKCKFGETNIHCVSKKRVNFETV